MGVVVVDYRYMYIAYSRATCLPRAFVQWQRLAA